MRSVSTFFILPSTFLVAAFLSSAAAQSPAVLLVPVDPDGRLGRPLVQEQPAILDAPLAPGSLAKVATLLAALESGTISPDTRISCLGRVTVEGHTYTCSHPDVGRPLAPAEALAHSCNAFFASAAARLPRGALDGAFIRLGLAPPDPKVPTVRASLGLEGVRATPRQLLAAFVRLAAGSGVAIDPRFREVVIEGMRGAATYGTARCLGDSGIAALAKTGTVLRGGTPTGLVVAVLPPEHPTRAIVVVAPGSAGAEAAAIAARRLQQRAATGQPWSAASSGQPAGRVTPPATGGGRPDDAPPLAVRIGRPDGHRYDVAVVALEDYVAGVVAGEAASGSGVEALKAMAIVGRTFALANPGRHASEGFDLCALTHCQVMGRATSATRAAAEATRGLAIVYDGRPAQIFYTASCGGHTERPSAVWPGAADPPYLVARAEPACALSGTWSTEVSAAQVATAVRAAGARGEVVRSLRVIARTGSGRAAALEVDGFDPPIVEVERFRLALGRTAGWQLLKSTAFDVERRAGGYRFVGRGRGHGVGLCVEGAARQAREGRTAADILSYYFPGSGLALQHLARVTPWASAEAGPLLEIRLPAGAEKERAAMEQLARTGLADASRAASVPAPPRASLTFHATAGAYARATGLPWWTSGASRGDRVDLLPPSALRSRGLLERTVRHEMAHLVIGTRLKGRPLWVQEGAAMFLSGEIDQAGLATPAGEPNARCPRDEEIARPASATAARRAYLAAAACFQRELRAGHRWNQVGAAVSTSSR